MFWPLNSTKNDQITLYRGLPFVKLLPHPENNNLKKTPHSITLQCMGRGLGHLAAHMKDFIKNGSKIKIFKIPQILMKISKYSILDHM